MSDQALELLEDIRTHAGTRRTPGLTDEWIARLLPDFPELEQAIRRAALEHRDLRGRDPRWAGMDEAELCDELQAAVLNFYPDEGIMPYVPLAASGPWIVSTHGAVLHDDGGYGMLGQGHAPRDVLEAMSRPWVQANVMAPSLSQRRLTDRLQREIGHSRSDGNPYTRFAFLNSGSESVTFAMRLADLAAQRVLEEDDRHRGKRVVSLVLEEGFHGRTDRPARLSHSTRKTYVDHLASYQPGDSDEWWVPINDVQALEEAFEKAEREGVFFDAVVLEPVQGEGVAGLAMTRTFYDRARALSARMGSVLLVDSVQAGLRAHGCLSIVDYPGFQDCMPPDVETWSKALNAGQVALSVIGVGPRVADLYVPGVYGNTMTGNPRAMEVACAVLDAITPELRENVTARGREILEGLRALGDELPGAVLGVTGTGLMVSAELDPERFPVTGFGGLERWCRMHGLSLIHAGDNGVRFTPHFAVTSAEIELMLDVLRQGMRAMDAAGLPAERDRQVPDEVRETPLAR